MKFITCTSETIITSSIELVHSVLLEGHVHFLSAYTCCKILSDSTCYRAKSRSTLLILLLQPENNSIISLTKNVQIIVLELYK